MRPRVVICGSYHRDDVGLRQAFLELESAGCRVLSPLTLNFVDITQEVVHTNTDTDVGIYDLEAYHLRTIRDADFIWLHVPDGVAGLSTAFEMGYAKAWNKPMFSKYALVDKMLDCQVMRVHSLPEALALIGR